MNVVILDGEHLTLEEIHAVSVDNVPVDVNADAVENIQTSRNYVEQLVEQDEIVYGVTTGFGKFSNIPQSEAIL